MPNENKSGGDVKSLDDMDVMELVALHNANVVEKNHVKSFKTKAEGITAVRSALERKKRTVDQKVNSRGSRLPTDQIASVFKGVELSVAEAAKKVTALVGHAVSEREVRLGIDALRRKKVTVVRTKKSHFKIA